MTSKAAINLAESRKRAAKLKAERLASTPYSSGGEKLTQSAPSAVVSDLPKIAASSLIQVHKSGVVGPQGFTSTELPPNEVETAETTARLRRISKLVSNEAAFWEWLSRQPGEESPVSSFGGEALDEEAAKELSRQPCMDWPARAERGRQCGGHLIFHDYFTHPERPNKLAGGFFCGQNHLCTFCSSRRAARALQRMVPLVQAKLAESPTLRAAMLTLTQRNIESLPQMIRQHFDYCGQMLQRRRDWKKGLRPMSSLCQVEGGIGSCETKRGKGSGLWHFHAHWLVLVPQGLDVSWFKEEWAELCGYEPQVDFRYMKSCRNLRDGELPDSEALAKDCMEVVKYALKTTDLGWVDRLYAFKQLRGKRLIRTFGSLYGYKAPESETDDLEGLEAYPYREVVWKYFKGTYQKKRESYCNGEMQIRGCEWEY